MKGQKHKYPKDLGIPSPQNIMEQGRSPKPRRVLHPISLESYKISHRTFNP